MLKNLALFDFDGTITKKDSLIHFIKYSHGSFNYYKGLFILSPMLLIYKLNIITNDKAKEKLISHFFKGWDNIYFRKVADTYSISQIDKIVRPTAIEKIKQHQANSDKILVVSASMECWLNGWCDKNNIEVLGTRLEVKEGLLTGRFTTKNCNGIEKVNRIKEYLNLDDYNVIYAYGDSNGDKEMLGIADKKYFKYF